MTPVYPQPIGVRGEEISTAPCVNEKPVPVEDSGAITSSENPRCLEDPEFAAFAGKDVCTNAPGIGRLVIRPVGGTTPYTIAEGEKAFFSAWQQFVYDDGTIKEKNVTQKARWVSSKTTVATTEGGGEFLGKDVAADTTVNIQAFYTPSAVVDSVKKTHPHDNVADPEKLVVTDACIGNAVDIVLVVDRSGSMTRDAEVYEGGGSRITAAKAACQALIENSKLYDTKAEVPVITPGVGSLNPPGIAEYDRVALISYAGSAEGSADEGAVTLHSGFVKDKVSASGIVASELGVAKECKGGTKGGYSGCWTGMGAGLQMAYDLLKGDVDLGTAAGEGGARSTSPATQWPRKLIVVLTDGLENVCDPDPETVATAIAADTGTSGSLAHDTMIVVIGFMLDEAATMKRCDGSSTTVGNYLKLLANCAGNSTGNATALTFFPATGDELKADFAQALRRICEDNKKGSSSTGSCLHLSVTGLVSSANNPVFQDKYEYDNFTNWVVCKNSVTLMGYALWDDVLPADGIFVGLIGDRGEIRADLNKAHWKSDFDTEESAYTSDCQIFFAPFDHNFGGIQTRHSFLLKLNTHYRLTLRVAGNITMPEANFSQRGGKKLGSSIRVSVGGTQAGVLGGKSGKTASDVDETGSLEKVGNLPVTVTRKWVEDMEPLMEEFEEIAPSGKKAKAHDLVYEIEGDGGEHVIRVEQFPYGYKEAMSKAPQYMFNVNNNGNPVDEDGKEIFGVTDDFPDACTAVKGGPDQDALNISDFSGFVASDWSSNLVYVYKEKNDDLRRETSGADEQLCNVPYGVNLSVVTLESGTKSGNVFTPDTTVVAAKDWKGTGRFQDDFASEGAKKSP